MYFILLIVAAIVSIYAQHKVKSNFNEYAKQYARSGYTGAQVAQAMLSRRGINNVSVQAVQGSLTDHYDPKAKAVRLSESVYNSSSLSAISVAAHEVGHAIQDNEDFAFMKFRYLLAPVASFTSQFVYIIILLGLFINAMQLVDLGIVLFSIAVLFQIITLPVEFDASRRAIANLQSDGFIYSDEVIASKKVLGAAALTYIAAMSYSIIQLLRLIAIRNSRRD